MKKLLLIISWIIFIGFTSCRNTQQANSNNQVKANVDTANRQGNANATYDGAVAMPVGGVDNSTSSTKDTLAKPKKATAIIHSAPDQQKIDSIKNSKPKY